MEKKKSVELKIYELLGIKKFRKMAFTLRDALVFPLTIKMSIEERKNFLYNKHTNYTIGKIKNIDNLKDFKLDLLFNGSLHMIILLSFIPDIFELMGGIESVVATVVTSTGIVLNSYCIMLQRYNWIRINQTINKCESREAKQKEEFKKDLRKDYQLLNEYTSNMSLEKYNEKEEMHNYFEEKIENATLEELKKYKSYMEVFIKANEKRYKDSSCYNESYIDSNAPKTKVKR